MVCAILLFCMACCAPSLEDFGRVRGKVPRGFSVGAILELFALKNHLALVLGPIDGSTLGL